MRHAAVDGRHAKLLRARDDAELLGDLRRQLSRRDEHERAHARVAVAEALRDRDGERERLARARRRAREDVETGERVRKDEGLDAERFVDAAGGERVHNGRAHAEFAKGLLLHMLFDSFVGSRPV